MKYVLIGLLKLYRLCISPLYGQVCRFYPGDRTASQAAAYVKVGRINARENCVQCAGGVWGICKGPDGRYFLIYGSDTCKHFLCYTPGGNYFKCLGKIVSRGRQISVIS
jgi:hypothetical protein